MIAFRVVDRSLMAFVVLFSAFASESVFDVGVQAANAVKAKAYSHIFQTRQQPLKKSIAVDGYCWYLREQADLVSLPQGGTSADESGKRYF